MANRYAALMLAAADEAEALRHADPIVRKLVAQRKTDNDQILKALEIAGHEIALLKAQAAAPGGPGAAAPAHMPKRIEALAEKLQAQSIARSRAA